MYTSRLVLSLAALLLASCGTTGFRVPVLVPAPVNLVQYQTLGVDRFTGDGCQPFSEQLTEALRAARNPLSGEQAFTVLHRRDVDQALDRAREERSGDFDERAMAILNQWRSAQVALSGAMQQHVVHDALVVEQVKDKQGRLHDVQVRRCTAEVAVAVETKDLDSNTLIDRVELRASTQSDRRPDPATGGEPGPIDHGPLLAAARTQVVEQFLRRVLPHTIYVQVSLYTDGDVPDLQVGNGYAETGNWSMAIESYQRALTMMTGELAEVQYKALYNLGVAYEFTDQFTAARQSLQQAYAMGQDKMILQELQRVDRREQEVQRLQQQAWQLATPQ